MRPSRVYLYAWFACLLAIIRSGCGNRVSDAFFDLEPYFPDRGVSVVNEDEPPPVFAETPQTAVFEKFSNSDVVRVLGVKSQSSVCCVSSRPGRVDCFVRGPWSNILHMSAENGEYGEWNDLGGWIAGDIECVSATEDSVDVLATDSANFIILKQYKDGEWGEWIKGTDQVLEAPSCVARTTSWIDCAIRHCNSNAYAFSADKGAFALKLVALSYSIRKRPTCGSFDANSSTCFFVNVNGQLVGRVRTVVPKPAWGSWIDLKQWTRQRPTVTSWPGVRMDLFALDMRNEIVHKTYNGEWSAWFSLGGEFESAPECVSTGPSTVHCFAIGRDLFLYGNTLNKWRWSGWNQFALDTHFFEKPSCVLLTDNKICCYLITNDRKVVELIHTFS